ncbi:MAG: MltA domain-containing protein [Desulfobacterales bacterium]
MTPMRHPLYWRFGVLILLLMSLTGCERAAKTPLPPAAPPAPLRLLAATDLPLFADDRDLDGLAEAIHQSLTYLKRLPPERAFPFGADTLTADTIMRALMHFSDFLQTAPTPAQLDDFVRTNYRVYRTLGASADDAVLFTGYYEPIIAGSRIRSAACSVPVLGRPTDLVTIDLERFSARFKGETLTGRLQDGRVVPYFERREITDPAVFGERAEAVAWVADPLDLFFLQVQGSGQIQLQDGSRLRVQYHASNGHPYRSIGRHLIDSGKIPREEMSMQRIRSYLEAHPEEIGPVLNHNPSFVFFKIEEIGPLGALNVPLTPGRSIALDRRIFPPAALCFIQCQKPLVDTAGHITQWRPFSRFVLNQDTGGAIQGPGRADLFWGSGATAEISAGHLQHPGSLFFLVLREDRAPS